MGTLGAFGGVLASLPLASLVASAFPTSWRVVFVVVPALTGYLLRAAWTATAENAVGSVGTGVGWTAFLVVVTTPLTSDGGRAFVDLYADGVPLGIILTPVVALVLLPALERALTWAVRSGPWGPPSDGGAHLTRWRGLGGVVVAVVAVLGSLVL